MDDKNKTTKLVIIIALLVGVSAAAAIWMFRDGASNADAVPAVRLSEGGVESAHTTPRSTSETPNHVQADKPSAPATDLLFANLTASERNIVDAALQEKFFRNGDPQGYRRHRLVRIDTQALRTRLEVASAAENFDEGSQYVEMPLFEDSVIDVAVDTWVEGGFGVVSGYGHYKQMPKLRDVAKFTFNDKGRLEASIIGMDTAVLISNISDNVYYVVMELDLPDRTD